MEHLSSNAFLVALIASFLAFGTLFLTAVLSDFEIRFKDELEDPAEAEEEEEEEEDDDDEESDDKDEDEEEGGREDSVSCCW